MILSKFCRLILNCITILILLPYIVFYLGRYFMTADSDVTKYTNDSWFSTEPIIYYEILSMNDSSLRAAKPASHDRRDGGVSPDTDESPVDLLKQVPRAIGAVDEEGSLL